MRRSRTPAASNQAADGQDPITRATLRAELQGALEYHTEVLLQRWGGQLQAQLQAFHKADGAPGVPGGNPTASWTVASEISKEDLQEDLGLGGPALQASEPHRWLSRSPTCHTQPEAEGAASLGRLSRRSTFSVPGVRQASRRLTPRLTTLDHRAAEHREPWLSEAETEPPAEEQDVQAVMARTPSRSRTARGYFARGWTLRRRAWQCCWQPWGCECLASVVMSPGFEYMAGLFVVLNALTLGIETNYEVTHRVEHIPHLLSASEAIFCVLFTFEQLLRLAVHGTSFFTMPGWAWNIFDISVVGLQLLEQFSHVLTAQNVPVDVSVIRMCRLLRLIRITRLIRVVRLIQELRTLVASILGSLHSLAWTLLLLMLVIYTFSILFTQIISEAMERDVEHAESLSHWFGSLGRTSLTLFEAILGGVSWEEVVWPLVMDVSPLCGGLFCFYVAFCVFALMNVVTGVFVEKASQTAREHKDMYIANHISDLFFNMQGVDWQEDCITWDEFQSKMDAPEMKEYFKAINVDPSEAYGLFQLLDTDGSGDVDCSEIVNGLLRLRGNARALELSLLMSETSRIHQTLEKQAKEVERRFAGIARVLAKATGYGRLLA